MAVQAQYLAYILEQLAMLPAMRFNRMFGGVGLYSEGLFFGLIDDDTLFFKTGDANVEDYRVRNSPKFMPFPDRPEAVLGYHQVPADVIEDAESLVEWARKSLGVALSAQAKKAARKKVARKRVASRKVVRKTAAKKPVRKTATLKKPVPKKPLRKKK